MIKLLARINRQLAPKAYCKNFIRNIGDSKKLVLDMKDTTVILERFREQMKNVPINAYIVPTDDAHQSEYICPHDERRAFISGFDGSAGTAVITETDALLWTDGRYYQQARKQLDNNWNLMKDGLPDTPSIGDWLVKNVSRGGVVGVDPNTVSYRIWDPLQKILEGNEITLKPIEKNLIDLIWDNQPKPTSNKVIHLDQSITGQTIGEKLIEIRKKMVDKGSEVLVVTALDEVAWVLNTRGTDIDYNPVFFAYVLITLSDLHLFIDSSKLPSDYQKHFQENGVQIHIDGYENVHKKLQELTVKLTGKVWISLSSSYGLNALVPTKKRLQEITPIAVMKALKNPIEVAGMRNCHIRDGVALCQYFSWLEEMLKTGQYVDEISGATKLEEFRSKQNKYMGLSFTTISASGPNGSVIHYHPAKETNRPITTNELYLCDSGAQFLDGTTDVTRTIHFGTPTDYEKECYTRVLKGQITLGTTVFPAKVKGQFLDTLARKALWDVGLDYGHGTGHGIGHYLNVHEGPMGIGIRLMPDDPGLQENMFLSNEPGYYEVGKFGIRIEDIVQIVPANITNNFAGRGALTFSTVTMCPIQTKLIKSELLTEQEKNHLNSYHKIVWETISPILIEANDNVTLEWLKREIKAI